MKKVLCVFLCCVFLFAAIGCGANAKQTPELSRAEKARDKAVNVCKQYLDFDIAGSEAKEQLEDIRDALGDSKAETAVNAWIGMLVYDLVKKNNKSFEDHYDSLKNMNLDLYE